MNSELYLLFINGGENMIPPNNPPEFPGETIRTQRTLQARGQRLCEVVIFWEAQAKTQLQWQAKLVGDPYPYRTVLTWKPIGGTYQFNTLGVKSRAIEFDWPAEGSYPQAKTVKTQGVGAVRLWRAWNTPNMQWLTTVGATARINSPAHMKQYAPELRSITAGYAWPWHYSESHAVPSLAYEHCGFHGFLSPEDCYKMGANGIYGSFIGWGRMAKHKLGYRTQFAQLDSILHVPRYGGLCDPGPDVYDEWLSMEQMYATHYGVPLLMPEQAKKLPTYVEDFSTEMIRRSDEDLMKELTDETK